MKQFKLIISYIVPIVLMYLIFHFSNEPAIDSGETSKGVIEFIYSIYAKIFNINQPIGSEHFDEWQFVVRKIAHFSIYTALSFSLVNAFYLSNVNKIYPLALGISLFYAISDEYHQYFIPGRSAEVRDVVIDFSGAILGAALYHFIIRRLIDGHKKDNKKS